jgi:hypothetical protein
VVICPDCGAAQREGTGVCINGHRFAPGTDERAEPRRHRKPPTPAYGKLALLIGTVVLLVGAYTWSSVQAAAQGTDVRAPLATYAEGIARGQAEGTITAETVARMREAARVQSGCGYVTEFVLGMPASSPTGGIGGATPQEPTKLAEDYIAATYGTDVAVAVVSLDEQQLIVAAAWACE